MTFNPSKWLPGPHAMTIWGSMMRLPRRLETRPERWELPDGDFVDVERLPGPEGAPLVVVCHGLEGSSRAGYVRGLMAELGARGVEVMALNFRGCSGPQNKSGRMYHSGDTGDLRFVVEQLVAERPRRAIGLAGFSLGGNVVVKYLGERPAPEEVRAAAVVSVPFDLGLCARALDGPGLFAYVYRERFLRRLRKKALAKAEQFPSLLAVRRVRAAKTFFEFDDAVTAPMHGFSDAHDYWTRSSSGPFVGNVDRPLYVLHANDDPLIPPESLPHAAVQKNPNVWLELVPRGGHVGFVSGPIWRPRRWAEARVAEVLTGMLGQGAMPRRFDRER